MQSLTNVQPKNDPLPTIEPFQTHSNPLLQQKVSHTLNKEDFIPAQKHLPEIKKHLTKVVQQLPFIQEE
jgi:hypothetical protein